MYQVTKRDGATAPFEIGKISAAITKAFEALSKQYHPSVIDMLALRVTADFEPKIQDGLIAVEDIQDSVEKVLSEAGYADVAKAYILYRKHLYSSTISWWVGILGLEPVHASPIASSQRLLHRCSL